ncbi:hypothetical protein [Tropicimonas sp. IMCC34043]|uniref:hypothetical protein n=1 Tax=Tropicimonas sp. IMCC34043 TaxID=2248760 RepID=UPI000E2380F3|nr:hypothetical protein [Tropicimonas sp. IMCC34043]
MTTEFDRNPEGDLDRELEAFFQAMRTEVAEPTPDLMARILEDAYGEQDLRAPVEAAPVETQARAGRRFGLGAVLAALGGWPSLAGLACATIAGLWIGFHPPVAVDTLSLVLFDGSYNLTMDSSLPEYGFLLSDG